MDAADVAAKIIGIIVTVARLLFWYMEALFRQFVPPGMKSIDNEVILVTGAASGIGKEICRYIVNCGTNIKLVLWDINIRDLEKLARELEKSAGATGLKVYPFQVDISTRENIDSCCEQVKDQVGPVTIIFNNAGIAPQGNFLQLTNDQVEKTLQVNLMSHLWIIRQFLPEMVTNNHGRIINICSMGGLKAANHALPYFSSKFGVNGYTEALKAELALFQHHGVHCSTVYPYFVQTPLIKSLAVEKKSSSLPNGFAKFMQPEDVAKKIVDGMRREFEFIYLPAVIPIVVLFEYFIPMKARKLLESTFQSNFAFKNAEEQKRFLTPLSAPNNNMKGKKNK